MNAALRFLAVGDRVRNTLTNWPSAIVTELTDTGGFLYRFDERHDLGPRYGYSEGGEVFAAGVDGWVRVIEAKPASTPGTKYATMHQLRHHAESLESAAKDARAMVELMAVLPDPVGPFVIEIAHALRPHGLSVVDTTVARTAIMALETFSALDGEDDHPGEAQERIDAAIKSLNQSITA